MAQGNDSHNFLHFSDLNISLGVESKINSLCVFQSKMRKPEFYQLKKSISEKCVA